MTATQTPDHGSSLPEYHTDLPVGEILRRTRVHYNQSIDDVAAFMRIRASQLDAIEKGDVEQLPGRVYAIGYVRTYSEYLGLDGEKMVQLFKQQSLSKTKSPELHFPVAASESKGPNFFFIFSSIAALAVVIGGWALINNASTGKDSEAINAIPNVPTNMRVADVMGTTTAPVAAGGIVVTPDGKVVEDMAQPTSTDPALATTAQSTQPTTPAAIDPAATATTDVAAQSPATDATIDPNAATTPATPEAAIEPAAPPPKQITMTVKERSWVEVRDKQGKAILSRILKPGEIFIVPEENYGLRLDTGNAGGLEFVVDGTTLEPFGKAGDILRGMVLDGPQLKDKYKAVTATPAATPASN